MLQTASSLSYCRNLRRWLTPGLVFVLSNIAVSQAVPGLTLRPEVQPVAGAILPSGTLGPDDMVEITVSHCPELTRNFRVSADGTLSLPLLGKPVQVSGFTPIEVTEKIRHALIQEQILTEPVVNVSVLEYRSRPVSVVGAVNHPLTFQATGQINLLDAVAMAGGLSPTAGGNILVTRGNGSNANAVESIPVRELLSGRAPALNLPLHGGENIRIPESDKIFVAGNVLHPGMYPMQSDAEMTVVKAITLSSGLAPFSATYAYIYRRKANGTDRDEVKVALNRIVAHKEPDVALRADDILYVPTNDGKKLASRVFTEITGVGQAAAGYAITR